jgi:hypothetical protein
MSQMNHQLSLDVIPFDFGLFDDVKSGLEEMFLERADNLVPNVFSEWMTTLQRRKGASNGYVQ